MDNLEQLLEKYRDMQIELRPHIEALKELETAIKNHVRETAEVAQIDGASVKIRRGSIRTKWDTKALEGYAVANPDVLEFMTKTQTADVVTIKVD